MATETVKQTWERITGRAWSEARSKGYTNGTLQQNLALQAKLLGGWNPYAPQVNPVPKPAPIPAPAVVTSAGSMLPAFVNQWNGRYCDYDGGLGPQCVDLTKAWQARLGKPVTRGNAINWPANADKNAFVWVANALNRKPDPGDIVVFTGGGGYGHVGICLSADLMNLTCFEQCYPVSTLVDKNGKVIRLGTPCTTVFHRWYGIGTSTRVIGWLKPR